MLKCKLGENVAMRSYTGKTQSAMQAALVTKSVSIKCQILSWKENKKKTAKISFGP